MIAPRNPKAKKRGRSKPPGTPTFDLPYRVELWHQDRSTVEKIVARAHSETLARAIFNSACEEFPERYLSLWRGRERLDHKG